MVGTLPWNLEALTSIFADARCTEHPRQASTIFCARDGGDSLGLFLTRVASGSLLAHQGRGAMTRTGTLHKIFPRDQDAVEIGELYRKGCGSVVDSVCALLEAGHRLIAKKKNMKHGEWLPWLAAHADDLGFDVRKAQRLMAAGEKYDVNVVY